MKNILMFAAMLSFFSAILLASCTKSNVPDEDELIEKLKKGKLNNLETYKKDSLDCGVCVYIKIDEESPKGEPIAAGDSIFITYTAQSLQQNLAFDCKPRTRVLVSDLIPGLRLAIIGLPRNTEGRIIIPSSMAYGSRRVGKLDPKTALYFDYFKVE